MKRFLISLVLLASGAALGVGGLYVGLHWDQFNPLRDKQGAASHAFLGKLRSACTADHSLKGAYIKSVDPADGKLRVRGWVAGKEQLAGLEAVSRTLLADHPDLLAQCAQGVSVDGVKVVTLLDPLPLWQAEFEEGKGAEKDTPENAITREVMRTTRLDGMVFDGSGRLIVSGVCVRGNNKTEATGRVLLEILKGRLETAGVTPDLMPELAIDIHYHANPATAIQNKLAKVPGATDVRVLSAWYDGKGKLHLEAIVTHEDQRKFIDDALDALLKDPQTLAMMASPANKEAVPDFVLRAVIFEGDVSARELQKKLVAYALKENKPLLRRVRLANIVPTAILNEKKETVTDVEGNSRYLFRVTGRLLETDGERSKIEGELSAWLEEQLPRMLNADQSPILPKLELTVRESPVIGLQERLAQRGLDGAVFTDALFDADGKLEISGRQHLPGVEAKQTIEIAVRDLLADEMPWTLELKAHEASKDAAPIAWSSVVPECQATLAGDAGLGRRVRLDRLYFNYVKGRLSLVGEGAFLAEAGGENPGATIAKSIDAVIRTRGKADVSVHQLKTIKNPLADFQNLFTERADLDGVLLTQARYGADGRLRFDGHLGDAKQKEALSSLLTPRLIQIPGLLKKVDDAKKESAWSIDDLKPYTLTKGESAWTDVLHACQRELAAAVQPLCVQRAYFLYADAPKGGGPRPLALHVKAIALTNPREKVDATALAKELDAACKRLFPKLAIEQAEVDLHEAVTPILELQKWAVEKRYDGVFFKDASYDRDGKLVFAGFRGGADQLKLLTEKIDQLVNNKDKRSIAPWGVADLSKMRVSPWEVMLDQVRATFASDAQALLKQTRIDRAYFEHDAASAKARIRFEGICIYQGKTPMPEQVLAETLKKQLQAKGIEGFEIGIEGIERKSNPVIEMQKKAFEAGVDGVDFSKIGFDAKGVCYVRLPFVPKGQEANVRKLLDDAAKAHPYLKGIQQR